MTTRPGSQRPDLIAALLADDEEEWGTANRGRAVTWYWLRDNLRHLLIPPGTERWEGPPRGQAWQAVSRILASASSRERGSGTCPHPSS